VLEYKVKIAELEEANEKLKASLESVRRPGVTKDANPEQPEPTAVTTV